MTNKLFEQILAWLAGGERFALATVISRTGSGPREAGASMLVGAGGVTLGTVGGGTVEAKVIALALEAIRHSRSFCRQFVLTQKQAADSGMICGGRMEVLVEYWDGADALRREIVERALRAQATGRPCLLLRSMRESETAKHSDARLFPRSAALQNAGDAPPEAATPVQTGLGLLNGDDFTPGSLDLSGLDREILTKERRLWQTVLINGSGVRYLIQPAGSTEKVIIAGAGHIAQELAPLCKVVGFVTAVIDDRPEFANGERFPAADEILVLPSFENIFQKLEINENSFIVIVTRGHEHDRTVLAQALRTRAGYIGMIGSRKKRDAVYRALRQEGFFAADTERVRCPIGLAIGAQTPAEIAVSIAAELIAVRSGKGQGKSKLPLV
jgi:xanthine dehydrogenase accessory factor